MWSGPKFPPHPDPFSPPCTLYSSSGLLGMVNGPPSSESLRTLVLKCRFLSLLSQLLLGYRTLHFNDTEADSCADCHLRATTLLNQIFKFPDCLWALSVLSHAVPLSRMPFLPFPTWCALCTLRFTSRVSSSVLPPSNQVSFSVYTQSHFTFYLPLL